MSFFPSDMVDAVWMLLSLVFIGAVVGLVLHHWPFPVNESVFVPGGRQ